MPRRRYQLWGCRAALLWTAFFYLAFQGGLFLVTERWLPLLRDPEYGSKLARLRTCLIEEPHRELIMLLGSSRIAYGFRPDVLAGRERRLFFNFGMTGAGPITELLCLRRLLAAGIHPDRVVIEVLPPNLHQEGSWGELRWLSVSRLGWDDLRLIRRYAEKPQELDLAWGRAFATPWFTQRFCILSRYAAGWLPWEARQDVWLGLDRFGWMTYPHTVLNPMEQQRALEFARKQYQAGLMQFRITPIADQALRDLLRLCQRQQISATLLLMPEGSIFQSWYPAPARAAIETYLTALSREYGVALVDARSWLPDRAFFDSHHLHPDGATAFTQQFARAVVASWSPRPTASLPPPGSDSGAVAVKRLR